MQVLRSTLRRILTILVALVLPSTAYATPNFKYGCSIGSPGGGRDAGLALGAGVVGLVAFRRRRRRRIA